MKALVIAEHDGHQLHISTRQAIRAAQALSAEVDVLVLGSATAAAARAAASISGVQRVRVAEAAHFAQPGAEDVAALIATLATDYGAILGAHDSFVRDVLPRVAGLLDVGMLSDVLEIRPGHTYVRPIYAGKLLATVRNDEAIQILSVRASRFEPAADGGEAVIEALTPAAPDPRVSQLAVQRADATGPELGSARVVVSGGRSLGSPEQFQALLQPLARQLGAALGATRAAVDAGYAPNEIQVGQTGVTVAPDCYIAVGVSGAQQHTAGMKDSKVVVAINADPDAPIFEVADYGLVADLFTAVPELTAALSRPH